MSRASYPMAMSLCRFFLVATAVAVVLARPAKAADEDLRAQFRLALEQAEQGLVPSSPDGSELRAYVLYPYLEGVRLLDAVRRTPGEDTDRAVMAFLDAQAQLPLAAELRGAWLTSLAERRQWAVFLRHYTHDPDLPVLACHAYQARIDSGDATVGAELQAFWEQAPQMPQACAPVFEWLDAQGGITPTQVVRRARKALADGNLELAQWLLRKLPPAQAAPLQQWVRLLRDPARELALLAERPDAAFEWDGVLAGFSRLARRDSERAYAVLGALARARIGAQRYAQLERWAALGLAWDHRAEALALFARLPAAVVDAQVHEWRIRAALWHGRQDLASAWIAALPPAQAAEPRWAYWRARMLERSGHAAAARSIYEALAQDNGYYGLLAAWRLQRPHRPRVRTFVSDPAIQAELLAQPGVQRARELYFIERDRWANAEWRAAVRGLDASRRLQAAHLAAQWGWHVQAVGLLAGLDALDILELSYPPAYEEAIFAHARRAGVPPELVYGVMRQESLFHPRAVSPSNAYGLLQLLLPTAREVARRHDERLPDRADLLRPEINIPLGVAYLREMRERFGGQVVVALAAYNAGPNAVRRWLPAQPMDADVWIENLPYDQTRGYVQKILWHMAAYHWQRHGEPLDLVPLLQPVRTPP